MQIGFVPEVYPGCTGFLNSIQICLELNSLNQISRLNAACKTNVFFPFFQICPWSTTPRIIPGPAPSSSASHRLTVSTAL